MSKVIKPPLISCPPINQLPLLHRESAIASDRRAAALAPIVLLCVALSSLPLLGTNFSIIHTPSLSHPSLSHPACLQHTSYTGAALLLVVAATVAAPVGQRRHAAPSGTGCCGGQQTPPGAG
jgi:hypothetical protein